MHGRGVCIAGGRHGMGAYIAGSACVAGVHAWRVGGGVCMAGGMHGRLSFLFWTIFEIL